ncbi:o-succinylbenzoate synthase [Brevibacterium litoralis]|uniref:o-succinylbenzoate synthase n=1 Tax=Brevibacterium litoralis TaxID=3138935 RepID=UPI0032ED0B1A
MRPSAPHPADRSVVPLAAPVRAALDSAADPREVFDRIAVVSLPMVTRFRGITTREAMLVHGPAGWAEFSPFLEYAAPEASRWLAAAVEYAVTEPPAPRYGSVPVNGTVPACPAASVPAVLARYDGVGTFKIKVAEDGLDSLPDDLDRIRAVRRSAPEASLRLDANGKYATGEEARQALRAFAEFDLQYVEQPVMPVEGLADLRDWIAAEGLPVRIAADESIRKAEDPYRVKELGAADVIVVKVQPLGGVAAALAVAEGTGLPVTVSSALDSSVGLSAGTALAAALPVPEGFASPPAAGLGTSSLFVDEVCAGEGRLRAVGGELPVGRRSPDEAALASLRATSDREEWWHARLGECWAHLRAGL